MSRSAWITMLAAVALVGAVAFMRFGGPSATEEPGGTSQTGATAATSSPSDAAAAGASGPLDCWLLSHNVASICARICAYCSRRVGGGESALSTVASGNSRRKFSAIAAWSGPYTEMVATPDSPNKRMLHGARASRAASNDRQSKSIIALFMVTPVGVV